MKFLFQRILSSLLTLLVISFLTFSLLRFAPGGPFDTERAVPEEVMKAIEAKYHLQDPLVIQYGRWLGHVLQGDLEESYQYTGQSVTGLIRESLPPSIILGSVSLLLALFFGVSLGAVAAWKKNTWLDWSALWLSIAGISLPTYLIASFLVYAFAIQLNWLPAALYDSPLSLVLPVITLAIRPLSMFVRLTRSSVLDVMQSDFIRTAQAKGLPQSQVLFKHVLKNSLIPVITLLGPMTANLLTGSFLVEVIFQLPGLGKYFVGAVMNRDYPLVMGVTLIYGIFLTFSNLLSDILCAWVDPRIQIANESKI